MKYFEEEEYTYSVWNANLKIGKTEITIDYDTHGSQHSFVWISRQENSDSREDCVQIPMSEFLLMVPRLEELIKELEEINKGERR